MRASTPRISAARAGEHSLLQNEFVQVTLDPDARLVRAVRTRLRFPEPERIYTCWGRVSNAFRGLDRATHRLLIDLRAAPSRNDPAFEQAFAPYKREVERGFDRVGVLVRTTAGSMQVQRIAASHQAPSPFRVFLDEGEALGWLGE